MQLGQEVQISSLVDINRLKLELVKELDIPVWVRQGDIQILLLRVFDDGTTQDINLFARRLLQIEVVEWEFVARTILGSVDPQTVQRYISQMEQWLSDSLKFQEVLQRASNTTIDWHSFDMLTETVNFALSSAASPANCTGPGTTVDANFACVCKAGWTGNVGSGGCSICPLGYYKENNGGVTCTACGVNENTDAEGSTGQGDCKCKTGFKGEIGDALGHIVCNPDGGTTNIVILVLLILLAVCLLIALVYILTSRRTAPGVCPRAHACTLTVHT
eukprot:2249267-Rhodomonas_salina.1